MLTKSAKTYNNILGYCDTGYNIKIKINSNINIPESVYVTKL